MNINYIVVQAGGKGTRMQHLTRNKPKALVPVNNLPMIFHLFAKYPDAKFIIIGDYKYDVLERYLATFATVDYVVVNANGNEGTCGGLLAALNKLPNSEPFMLIWSDLILGEDFDISDIPVGNYVGISSGFECRWKYENGVFSEERSSTYGVAGMFLLENKNILGGIPKEGEFVKWLSKRDIRFDVIVLDKAKEYGLLSEYNKLQTEKCRPFNRIVMNNDYIIKEGINEQGRALAVQERAWYKKAVDFGFKNLPKIYSVDLLNLASPLKLERINGKNVYEYTDLPFEQKKNILRKLVGCLHQLHELGSAPFDNMSFQNAYLDKTFDRLEKIRNLVPFANDKFVVVNNRKCRNVFQYRERLQSEFEKFKPEKFVLLHGDCTFSNLMLRDDKEPVLIDPRGYFGQTEFYGDTAYDWAKLYYSLVGNYDQFNLKHFSLEINDKDVQLEIASSGWEELENYFFELLKNEVTVRQIKLIHAIIWLSLTTYAWQDYDSICGAFYNGLYYLEEVL